MYERMPGIPEPIVIKEFHPKVEALQSAEQRLNQLATFALIINIFLLPSCFVHRVDAKPPVFRDNDYI